jgi:hypothetical protein
LEVRKGGLPRGILPIGYNKKIDKKYKIRINEKHEYTALISSYARDNNTTINQISITKFNTI